MSVETRNKHIARVHAVARELGLAGDDYRQWLKRQAGQESCAELTDAELDRLTDELKATLPQWQKAKKLIVEIGYAGFEDPRFLTIVQRVAKKDTPRLLSKQQLRNVIGALSRTLENRRKREARGYDGDMNRPEAA